jgi:hypothetical protein
MRLFSLGKSHLSTKSIVSIKLSDKLRTSTADLMGGTCLILLLVKEMEEMKGLTF